MSGAHPTAIDLCGRTLLVHRDFALIIRLEARFGPLASLHAKVRIYDLPVEQLRDLLVEIARGCDDPPSAEAVAAWIFDQGIQRAARQALRVTSALFLGAEIGDTLDDDEEEAGETAVDPRQASSAGRRSTAPATVSDGAPTNSGAPAGSNSAPPSPDSGA